MVICALFQLPYKAYAAVPALNALHDLWHIGTIYNFYMVLIWSIYGSYLVHIWFLYGR